MEGPLRSAAPSRLQHLLWAVPATLLLAGAVWGVVHLAGAHRPDTGDSQAPKPLIVAYRTRGVAPLRVRLDASGSTDNVGITAHRWDFDDGTTGEGAIVDHVFHSAGTYSVALTVEDAFGLKRTATQTITVEAPHKDRSPPQARLTASTSRGRVPLRVEFDASNSADNRSITRYDWSYDDESIGSGPRVTHMFTRPGRFDVRLTVRDAAGNRDEVEQTIVVEPGPASADPVAVLHASPSVLTAPGEVSFDGRASHDDRDVLSYRWDFGDGTTATGPSVAHRYSHAGRFLATLEVSDDSGQTDSATVRVVVHPPKLLTERVLFDDRWATGVREGAVGVQVSAASPPRNGRVSLQIIPQKQPASYLIRFDPMRLDAYDRFGFWVKTDAPAALSVRALLQTAEGSAFGPSVPVRTHLLPGAGGALSGVWQRAAIPLSALDADRADVVGFVWHAAEGTDLPAFALDDVGLLPPDAELPPLSDCTQPPRVRSFVERRETGLVAEGVPFRAVGANIYYAQQELSRHVQSQEMRPLAHVRQAMSAAVCSGINVIRILGFNDNPPETQDEAIIQLSPGVFREEGLRGLDLALVEARRHHLRVILTLTNNWSAYGGLPRYAAWAGVDPRRAMSDPQVRDWLVDYSRMLSGRLNTYSGIRYRDDPTILAIELANELRCQGCRPGQDATAFTAALARAVASDWPKHLVADGGEGFDGSASLYPGLEGTYVLAGDEGTSFSAIAEIPEIDLVSYHLYPDAWNLDDRETAAFIDAHETIARAAGKVAYLGEFGLRTGDAERGVLYDQWLQRLFSTNGGALGLVWQLTYPGRPDNDGFALIPGQSLHAIGALARQSHRLVAPGLDGVSVAVVRR